MNTNSFEKIINEGWGNKSQVNSKSSRKLLNAISKTIELVDSGKIRVAEKKSNEWIVNQWIKKAILLSFRVNKMKITKGPYAAWFDKVEGKTHKWNEKRFIKEGFRYVPNGVVRKGAYIAKNVVLMPSFVNIGASTRIIDRSTGEIYYGKVPAYSVVVPGSAPSKNNPEGPSLYCVVVVKKVDEKTRSKTSINDLLRD